RSGSVDPGALLYLMREHGLGAAELDDALNQASGLTGLAGLTGKTLEEEAAAGNPDAELALEVFAHRTAGAVAAMAVAAGGLDALVFTGGIGEGSSGVRPRICGRLGLLGVQLELRTGESGDADRDLAAAASRVRVLVIAAREELVIARAVRSLVG